MITQDDLKSITALINSKAEYLSVNSDLFDIFEGQLSDFVLDDLRCQFSTQSFADIKNRVSPINILTKTIDKLSQIYQQQPTRTAEDGNEKDEDLLRWYEESFRINDVLNAGNEFSNLFRNTLLQPVIDPKTKRPLLRVIPSNRFLVWSNDPINPMRVTHLILFMGSFTDVNEDGQSSELGLIHIWTDEDFMIIDSMGRARPDKMAAGEFETTHQFGTLPFVYVNYSANLLLPKQDTDSLRMSKLIPVLLSDLNYAVMYQAFSIIWTLDMQDEQVQMGPNNIWSMKSDPDSDKKPELGTIKPEIDIASVLNLVQSQFALWLNTKGIKPGSIGKMDGDNFASGISKIIDEADTAENRAKQVSTFAIAEQELWDLITNHMHPVWTRTGMIENQTQWTAGVKVKTNFAPQTPLLSRKDVVETQKIEVESGFTSTKRAIHKLNPHMTEKEIDELMVEIDEESTVAMPPAAEEPNPFDQEPKEEEE